MVIISQRCGTTKLKVTILTHLDFQQVIKGLFEKKILIIKAFFIQGTGHFTQLVWKSTTQLGCAMAVTTTNKVYGVCNYSPQGNIVNAGYFQNNVLPLSSSGY